MENKFNKFLTLVLALLMIGLTGAAFYIFQETDEDTHTTISRFQDRPESSHSGGPIHPSTASHAPAPGPSPLEKNATESSAALQPDAHEPRQIPRRLTEAEQEENRRELARMAEALPDNMWVPRAPSPGYGPEQGETLRKSIELSDKIRKGTASSTEMADYYAYKLKETRDKIELIRYIARRTEELSGETGKPYLTESDIHTGFERIEELEQLTADWQEKLDALSRKPASNSPNDQETTAP